MKRFIWAILLCGLSIQVFATEEYQDAIKELIDYYEIEGSFYKECEWSKNALIVTFEQVIEKDIEADEAYEYHLKSEDRIRASMSGSTPEALIQQRISNEFDETYNDYQDAFEERSNEEDKASEYEDELLNCISKQNTKWETHFQNIDKLLEDEDYQGVIFELKDVRWLINLTTWTRTKYNEISELIEIYESLLSQKEELEELIENEKKNNTDQTTVNTGNDQKDKTPSTGNNWSVKSDADKLADIWVINKQYDVNNYNLWANILRQELIWSVLNYSGVLLPTDYTCKWYFSDVTQLVPNSWACRSAEIAADNWIISKENSNFNPEINVTQAEALAMIFDSKLLDFRSISVDWISFFPWTAEWQKNVIQYGNSVGLIDKTVTFNPNSYVTRWEVFHYMIYILENESANRSWSNAFLSNLDYTLPRYDVACFPERKEYCNSEWCNEIDAEVFALYDVESATIYRCDSQPCDSYPGFMDITDYYVDIKAKAPYELTIRIDSNDKYVETVTLGLDKYVSYWTCK